MSIGSMLDARLLQLADRALRELAVLLDEDFLRLRVLDVARRALADEQLVVDLAAVLLAAARSGSSRCRRSS